MQYKTKNKKNTKKTLTLVDLYEKFRAGCIKKLNLDADFRLIDDNDEDLIEDDSLDEEYVPSEQEMKSSEIANIKCFKEIEGFEKVPPSELPLLKKFYHKFAGTFNNKTLRNMKQLPYVG